MKASKSYSLSDVADLEARLSAKKRGLAANAKMLEQRGAALPDGGAKLRLAIDKIKVGCCSAIDKIKVGCCSALGGYRDTVTKTFIMIYMYPPLLSNLDIFITKRRSLSCRKPSI